MGVARAFSTSSGGRRPSKSDREFFVACRAGNFPLSWPALHSKISMTTRAFNLDPWHVRREREVAFTRSTLEIGRTIVHARHEHL